MALLDIRVYGDPVLRRRAEDVTEFDESLEALAGDMVQTMLADDGVGLAAPQVGISKRFLVIGLPDEDDSEAEDSRRIRVLAMANPHILEYGEETDVIEEGCLSLPGIQVDIDRPATIRVRFQKLDGTEVEMEADGFLARVMQHEIDHLNAKLIVDYLPPLKRSMLKGKLREIEKAGPIRLSEKQGA